MEELSKHQPEEIMEQIEKIDDLAEKGAEWIEAMMAQITKAEQDCLTRIFTRFCLKKAKWLTFPKCRTAILSP